MFFILFNNLILSLKKVIVMDEEKNWMLMTYYCPTHGDIDLVKPIEIIEEQIPKKKYKERSSKKLL